MPTIGPAEWTVVLATLVVTIACVVLHFEILQMLNRRVVRPASMLVRDRHHRPTLLAVILALLALHVAEIWLFGLAFYLLMQIEGLGSIAGYDTFDLFDCIYFSASTYTTVGWGELYPIGPLRFLAGVEALAGFMMITWSASFTYLVMVRTWGSHQRD